MTCGNNNNIICFDDYYARRVDVLTLHLLCAIFPEAYTLSVNEARGGLMIRVPQEEQEERAAATAVSSTHVC
jgi:hypothetical protein